MSAHPETSTTTTPTRPARQAEGSVLGVAQAGVVVALLAIAAGAELKASAAAAHVESARRLALSADPYLVAALGGEVGHAAFRRPTRVRAWRIAPAHEDLPVVTAPPEAGPGMTAAPEGRTAAGARPAPEVERLHGYVVTAGPVDLTGTRARAFADALDDVRFSRESNKRCGFSPGVVVRWEDGVHAVDALLCFSCKDLLVKLDGRDATPPPARGSHVLWDFTPQRDALVGAAQAAFPGDEALKALLQAR